MGPEMRSIRPHNARRSLSPEARSGRTFATDGRFRPVRLKSTDSRKNSLAPVVPPSTAARWLVRLGLITAEHREHNLFLNRTVPSGTTGNSPAIYCRGCPAGASRVPLGTTETRTLPTGSSTRFAKNRQCSPAELGRKASWYAFQREALERGGGSAAEIKTKPESPVWFR